MRAWLPIAVLVLLVGVLGIWVYFTPTPEKVETTALSTLRSADVRRISFTRGEASADAKADSRRAAVTLERRGGTWYLTSPFAARAEPFQVERLLGVLDAHATARLPARDLAQYGLDAPSGRLTLDDQVFALGGVNPLTREQYVLTNDAVYAVPLSQRTALPAADALVSRALLGPDEYPTRFALPGFSMTLSEGRWRLEPDPKETTGDERNAWVDAWRNATALRIARAPERAVQARIAVTLKDGTELTLGIVQREPELVLVRPDEDIEYAFASDVGKRLLAPPPRKD